MVSLWKGKEERPGLSPRLVAEGKKLAKTLGARASGPS